MSKNTDELAQKTREALKALRAARSLLSSLQHRAQREVGRAERLIERSEYESNPELSSDATYAESIEAWASEARDATAGSIEAAEDYNLGD